MKTESSTYGLIDMEKTLLYSEKEIQKKVKKIAKEITKDYKDSKPLLIGVLKGSIIFLSDLIREIKTPIEIDFVDIKSYKGTESTKPELRLNTTHKIENREIILIDDILDTGKTMQLLKKEFKKRGAKKTKICTLLDKPSRRQVNIKPDYKGFEIPNVFVIGYGLDYNGKYRELPNIYKIKEK
ncbi:hypoxanthine phosphoribosyltransferase [Methanonatronarchaeum sp. AMET-Sl]|uniref:hypoxanthine phosphoribosyltransferase n=1 Tax=Methanonatronarchaeum sp. AMET-Sl TaxID=3037654 RepID=UPI00244E2444|nr:hypoxanthine phosphoribosyltransferase [Methanonatronarchaeum sp. AMET-Sl]WGI16667.1 hypoxanthine phosphoribosyltransferase [Methanonatronarchaeum sp. AMET-Sl]